MERIKGLYLTVILIVLSASSSYPIMAQEFGSEEIGTKLPEPDKTIILPSKEPDKKFTLSIYLPESYSISNQRYPVHYVLDGDASLDELTVMAQEETNNQDIITVGIGYGLEASERRPSRLRDFTSEPVSGLENTGGAEHFRNFIQNELIPFVEKNFRVNRHSKTLVGHSLSGFFALYTLFTKPILFDTYIAISPSLAIDNFQEEREHLSLQDTNKIHLFLAMGDREDEQRMQIPFYDFLEELYRFQIPCLSFKSTVIEDADHYNVVLPALKQAYMEMN